VHCFLAKNGKFVKKSKIYETEGRFCASLLCGQGRPTDRSGKYLEKSQDSLATRLESGERTAAAELVDRYYEQIYAFMRRLGYSSQVSEDLTQESFLLAWCHIGQLRDGRALNSWLYRIARNVSNHYRRRHRGKEAVGIEGIEPADGSGANDDETEHYEQLGRLKIAVEKLPIKFREVVVLHYMQHLTIAEAAEAMGIRQGTFKSRLNRTLKSLKKQMAEKGRR